MNGTSSHALLKILEANGIDRVFLVPGESYLGILDALSDFPDIDVVTCRHESGAGFMAVADSRLTGHPGVAMVSRGPGATNASIALHTAQQDAVPLILIVGQIPKRDLRREAFQEIEYQKMFGAIAKWVFEPTEPEQLPEVAFKAIRIATAGAPGPVVIVVPEDIQEQTVAPREWLARPAIASVPAKSAGQDLLARLKIAERPLIVAGGLFDVPGGREALREFAQAWHIPVVVSFRRHDIFDNTHPLYVGDLGLANPAPQIAAFQESDLILALGTRLGDITSQGYTFPDLPVPKQTFVHCYPDDHIVGLHFATDLGLVCDPVALLSVLMADEFRTVPAPRRAWAQRLRSFAEQYARLPETTAGRDAHFAAVVAALRSHAPRDAVICLDAGAFAAPVYRHFPFVPPQRLMAPLSGAMGYGVPAAVAAKLRAPRRKVVCLVGDGGFMMTGNEMIAAVERQLPIVFILSHNRSYGSIRIHQDREYPGRHRGTSLFNPDFTALAASFGMKSQRIDRAEEVEQAVKQALDHDGPVLLEVMTCPGTALPRPEQSLLERDVA